ncbi:hypothetical protein D3C71_1980240 [compost metagenome]
MLVTKHVFDVFGLKRPGKTDGACWNTVDVFRAQNACGSHGNVGRTVLQGAQGHFPGNLHARQIKCFDGVSADMQ